MDTTNILTEATATGTVAAPQTTPEPAAPTLAEVIGSTNEENKAGQPDAHVDVIPQQEPGWYAKRRAQDRAQWDAEHQASMTAMQEQVNTLREYFVTNEIDKLVSSGKIADREMAETYVRATMKTPAPQTQPATTPQRDAQGRFVATPKPSEVPAEIQQRANELNQQAVTLQKVTGVDVYGLYRSNPEYAQKVNSGEWDMTDVYNAHSAANPARNPSPSLIRNPNGSTPVVGFRNMSDDQFAKINAMLAEGRTIDVR